MTKSDLFLYISCNFCTFPSIFERFSTPFLPFSPVSTISRMAFQPPINDFTQKSKKKLAKIAENPQYFTTFIVFNNNLWYQIRVNPVPQSYNSCLYPCENIEGSMVTCYITDLERRNLILAIFLLKEADQ